MMNRVVETKKCSFMMMMSDFLKYNQAASGILYELIGYKFAFRMATGQN